MAEFHATVELKLKPSKLTKFGGPVSLQILQKPFDNINYLCFALKIQNVGSSNLYELSNKNSNFGNFELHLLRVSLSNRCY